MKTQTYATEASAKKAAAGAYSPAIIRLANGQYVPSEVGHPVPRGARAVSRWGTNRWRAYEGQGAGRMERKREDARVLIGAAREVHAERHGARTFLPGTRLPFMEAAKRAGIRSDRQRYQDAIEELEYEGAIERDASARHARGNGHYVVTRRGLNGAG